MEWLILVILVWIACGVFAYGLTFAYYQGKYPGLAAEDYMSDRIFALIPAVCGVVGLFASLICTNFGREYGLRWR